MREGRKTQAWKPDLKAVKGVTPTNPGVKRTDPVDGQTLPGRSTAVHYANLVKLPHTVFALPFALVGVVYASASQPVTLAQVFLVVLAFTAARFAAMGFNRIVDRSWDGKNPRTAQREIPAGKLGVRDATFAVVVSAAIFILAAAKLNRLCLVLSVPALLWILGYSYSKRFTNWSHLWLGGALAIAPVGGYLAVTGTWSTPWWSLFMLALAVVLWVAGFDIFYALQDLEFDREHGLGSAVVRLGEKRSILVAKVFHGMMLGGLVAFGIGAGFGVPFYVGLGVAVAILTWEHRMVRPGDLSRIDAAFFLFNGFMSIVVFMGTLLDRLL